MNVTWLKGSIYEALIDEIKSDIIVNEDDSVNWKIGSDFLIDALFEKVSHPYTIDNDILFSIFRHSLQKIIKNNELSKPDKILAEFKKRCDEKLRSPNNYVLVTSISIENKRIPKNRTINKCRISFFKETPKKYITARKFITTQYPYLNLSEQENFTLVTISVSAPDIRTAFQNAMRALNILRAVWQINLHKKTNFLASNKDLEYPSESIVSLGKIHTLHTPTGEKACETVWYEPDLLKSAPIKISNIEAAEKNLTSTLLRLRNTPFKYHIEETLDKYISAIDEKNHELRKMKIWSAIEKIIDSDDSKTIKKRISFFYENSYLQGEIIDSLRKSRNESTHGGKKPTNIELKNFQLCKMLEHLIIFYINNPFKTNSLNELLEIISSSIESKNIEQAIKNLLIVKKFRKN